MKNQVLNMEECNLVVNNLSLVEAVAKKFTSVPWCIEREDLISAGDEGLIKAARTYDSRKGVFSAYAWRCIRNTMTDEIRMFSRLSEAESEEDVDLLSIIDDSREAWEILDEIVQNAGLSDREWYVICSKYGIDCEPRTTNELATELDRTPQMVNLIKRLALEKMRLAA